MFDEGENQAAQAARDTDHEGSVHDTTRQGVPPDSDDFFA
jgi:hypothetical protein